MKASRRRGGNRTWEGSPAPWRVQPEPQQQSEPGDAAQGCRGGIRGSAPETGDYFKDEWFRAYVSEPPRQTLNVYGGSDYAVTSHGGDYTVHVVVGVDPENRMYLLDLWRGQASSDVWIEAWCDLVRKWRPALWAEE